MASASPDSALRVPGALIAAPSDLATAFPFGGTELGLVQAVQLRREARRELIRAEEFGAEVVDVLDLGEDYLLACSLRGWDSDAWAKVYTNTSVGAASGRASPHSPGAVSAGTLRSGAAFGLLFAPEDVDRHPAVYFPRALALTVEALSVDLNRTGEALTGVVFRATRRGFSAGDLCQVALLADVTL